MQNQPACASPDVDPEIFFPVQAFDAPDDMTPNQVEALAQKQRLAAEKVCADCPVRLTCLEDNLLVPYGIFGGLAPRARRKIATKRGLVWPDGSDYLDEVAIDKAVNGEKPWLTNRERREAVLRLRRRLAGPETGRHNAPAGIKEQMAETLGLSVRTVERLMYQRTAA